MIATFHSVALYNQHHAVLTKLTQWWEFVRVDCGAFLWLFSGLKILWGIPTCSMISKSFPHNYQGSTFQTMFSSSLKKCFDGEKHIRHCIKLKTQQPTDLQEVVLTVQTALSNDWCSPVLHKRSVHLFSQLEHELNKCVKAKSWQQHRFSQVTDHDAAHLILTLLQICSEGKRQLIPTQTSWKTNKWKDNKIIVMANTC